MMNSLLLEKNLREYLDYLRQTNSKGRHDPNYVNTISNKRIFKLMANKVQDANLIPNDIIDPKETSDEEKDQGDQKKKPIRRNYDTLCKKLNRNLLKPKICYGYSCSIPLLPGYHNLNEMERMLVESMRIYPIRFLQIKKEILEFRAMLGDNVNNDPNKLGLTPPSCDNLTFASFWKSMVDVLDRDKNDNKLYPSPIPSSRKYYPPKF